MTNQLDPSSVAAYEHSWIQPVGSAKNSGKAQISPAVSSDEGVDFVLGLCEALHVELPEDFNPFVHESGRRGLRVSEMMSRVENFVSQAGAAA